MEGDLGNEKIVVFKKYVSVMAANLAKTKLDAYGIPCFLTNEQISSLYPVPFMSGMEVGLHIFKDDEGRVSEILDEQT